MMRHSRDEIIKRLGNARIESDGSAIADCPACRMDGKGVDKLKVFANSTFVCNRYSGTEQAAHQKEILKALGLDTQSEAFISHSLFDDKLSLELSPAERGKVLVTARNCDSVLGRDKFDLNKMTERAKFASALPFSEQERQEITRTLIQLSDRFDRAQAAVEYKNQDEADVERVISKALPDDRIIEQTDGSVFAVFDPQTKDVTYSGAVECDGITYRPLDDDFVMRGGLQLPERLVEYHDEKTLDAEIEACIRRYCDAPERELKLSAKYVRLSYVADRLNEISYFRATGAPGSGKSRYIGGVGMLCMRPILVTSPSAASLYRMVDAYHPTLIIDECNFEHGSEDTTALMQVLNCGFQRLTFIPRMDKGADGRHTLRMFSAFGPKLIGSLKLSDSAAFESRCVAVALQKTSRKDIPFRLTERMLQDFAEQRSKLYLWRLRNWNRDYEQILDEAEADLKQYSIEPRFIQIAIPLYGLLGEDKSLKSDFARLLEGRTEDAASERRESLDGQIADTIHKALFEETEVGIHIRRLADVPEPNEGQPCELLPIEEILDKLKDLLSDRTQKQTARHQASWLGRQLKKLDLRTGKVNRRDSDSYDKKAIVFDREGFNSLFRQFSLPTPADFRVGSVGRTVNDCNQSTKPADTSLDEQISETNVSAELSQVITTKAEIADTADTYIQENCPFVSLDTETEPFDKKRGITSRNTKMIGLALCYDGEQADYHTDPASWALLMPEAEQTVIFHHAKFDLSVLERTGLPLPDCWEDTMIASHLLDENNGHGLKELAKRHLKIEKPLTFADADRMRLLDPEVFEEYARNDSCYTYQLWRHFKPQLEAEGLQKVYELEKALIPVVIDMEGVGMRLDIPLLDTLQKEVKETVKSAEQETYDHAGCKFDLHSPDKVAAILYDKLGLTPPKQTSRGKRSVDKEALKEIVGSHPVIGALLRFREVDKLASTFINVLPKFADENGRIHPEFRTIGPKGGRFSCSSPNIQQIPSRSQLGKRLRQAFIATPGNKLVVADYSQVELRVLAHFSRDTSLISAYTSETETDLHTLTASRMFNKPMDAVTKNERSIAKMINFGISYGLSAQGLIRNLHAEGYTVTESECESFMDLFAAAYPGISKYKETVTRRVQERGYVMSLFGRRRRLQGRDRREQRQAQNFVIQATAADMAKAAMVRLHQQLPNGAHLVAQIHDEFIVECREADAEAVRDVMVEVMTAAPEGFTIPLKVDAHVVNNWGEAK